MATATQRKRRLKRRHDHQAKTNGKVQHSVVQGGGVVHVFPSEAAAVRAFSRAESVLAPLADNARVRQAVALVADVADQTIRLDRGFLNQQTCDFLRGEAAKFGIAGRSKMKKADLIEALMEEV